MLICSERNGPSPPPAHSYSPNPPVLGSEVTAVCFREENHTPDLQQRNVEIMASKSHSQRQPLPFIIWYGRAVKVLIRAPILLELLWLYWCIKDSRFSGQRIGLALLLGLLYCDNCPQGGVLWSRLAICLAPSVIPHLFFYRLCHTTVIPRSSHPTSGPFMDNCNAAYFMSNPSWMPKLDQKYTSVSCHISLTWSFWLRFCWLKWRTRQKSIVEHAVKLLQMSRPPTRSPAP